jgi:hypothetical protein
MGPHTGVFDIHRTSTQTDGSKTYETLYAISRGDLPKLLMELSSVVLDALMDAVRPLHPDLLVANHFGVVVGLLRTGKEVEEVTRVRAQKLVVDPEKLAAQARVPAVITHLSPVIREMAMRYHLQQSDYMRSEVVAAAADTCSSEEMKLY